MCTLRWGHNGRDSVSNHQPHHCLLNCLFRGRSKKTSKLRVTGLCVGNSPGTGEFPAQMASNAENTSIWWRHHVVYICWGILFEKKIPFHSCVVNQNFSYLLAMLCCCNSVPGTHFTNDFSITIQIRWKFHLALIQLLVIISRQNLAHDTTAQLSYHVPNIVAITILLFGWEQNEISITFELWWKNC